MSQPLKLRCGTAWGAGLLLILAALVTYSNSFEVPFILDDNSSLKNNVSIRHVWPPEPAMAGGTRGRPLVNFSFALNYRFGGLAVAGYHGTNLCIHALAGLILMGVARRTLLLPIFAGKFAGSAPGIAFAASILWVVHPLQTEAVTYLVQRTESLMGLFYLLTLYCFVRGIEPGGNSRAWHACSALACFAGMGCKEVMVTAPVAVLLYDRTFGAGGFMTALKLRPRFYLALATTWLALAGLMTGLGDRGVGFETGVSSWHYALTECCVVVRYLKLVVWPAPLVFDYGSDTAASLADVWPCALFLVAGMALVIAALKYRPRVGFLVAWPFLLLAPTSSIVPVALQPMAEHRMYLPLAAIMVLAALVLERTFASKAWICVLIVGGSLGVVTYRRNSIYADEMVLWVDTVEKEAGNDRALQNLGTAYLNAGRMAQAQVALERALTINPANYQALNNLGTLHARTGRVAEAIRCFEKARLASPGFAEPDYNLGCILMESGRRAEARSHFETALRQNPDHGDAHINLAAIFSGAKKYDEAISHYSQALRVNPQDAVLYSNRAFAHLQLGQISAAVADYEHALQLRPEFEAARHNLEILRQSSHRPVQ